MNQPVHYRQPEVRPSCSRCGVHPGDAPFFSPQGHLLCQACFHAAGQAAAQRSTSGAFGGGLIHLGNEGATIDAGMRSDLEAKMLRRCAKCHAHAVTVVHVTFHYVNGITSGRTYEHCCGACNHSFKTESVFRSITELGTGIVAALAGLGAIAFASGWSLLVVLFLPLGVWMIASSIRAMIARLRNPVVPRLPT
ncbi:MAG: hypothetical protein KF819_31365 [Labilithrix sp.]|nr:hypothetical protein [Labilithrix sp.]